ncbi:RNA polymerase sigma factor [Streptomyces sp. NPDC059863]|uniref:RNA polymerase sigma factor n=1 Tax=unclassified Streptomyces TaxID=2593676 RepID=UPI003656E18C
MSSSPDTSTHTTGAHRAPRRAPQPLPRRQAARYERYLDGLFTYCLSVLCDHDVATEVLGEVLSISERQYGRCPSGDGERKAWLYALARWSCLRRLTEQRRSRLGAHSAQREPEPAQTEALAPETAERRRRELALLAWPEAAGTTPEQREILELAVRHQLGPTEVAAVLSMEPAAARELLASAACEVERTRAALAVVDTGDCPSVARLTGDHQVLLSAALRRELVRHVDDCPRCRRAAERAEAAGPWPGSRLCPLLRLPDGAAARPAPAAGPSGAPSAPSAVPPAVLPLVTAPREATYAAMERAPRARAAAPRFGRDGFPMDPKDRAARRERLRARAVTTTVVATVVAAPVLALWAAYRGAAETGDGREGSSVTAGATEGPPGMDEEPREHYENAGSARDGSGAGHGPGHGPGGEGIAPGVSVEVISDGQPVPPPLPGQPTIGRLSVEARPHGDTTMVTLRASGGAPVSWTAGTKAPWLRLSRHYGTLAPGESFTVQVFVDHRREPSGPWSARVAIYPAGSVVKIYGYGSRPPSSGHAGRPGYPVHPGHPAHPGHPGHPADPGTGGPTRPGPADPPGSSHPPGPGSGSPDPAGPSDPGPSDPGTGGPVPGDPQQSDPPPDPSAPDPSAPDPSAPGSGSPDMSTQGG